MHLSYQKNMQVRYLLEKLYDDFFAFEAWLTEIFAKVRMRLLVPPSVIPVRSLSGLSVIFSTFTMLTVSCAIIDNTVRPYCIIYGAIFCSLSGCRSTVEQAVRFRLYAI